MNFNIEVKTNSTVEIKWDSPLNSAAWVLHDEISKLQHVEPSLFNNMKGCLKLAIEKYLESVLKEEWQKSDGL